MSQNDDKVDLGFWAPRNVARFTEHLKIRQIAVPGSHEQRRAFAFYAQVAAEMDAKRDQAYQEVNEEFLGPNAQDYHWII